MEETDVVLYREPDEDVLVLGEMIRDAKLQADQLSKLPLSGEKYRGTLRVIAGAATRVRMRAERLLGESADVNDQGREPESASSLLDSRAEPASPRSAKPNGRAKGKSSPPDFNEATKAEDGVSAAILSRLAKTPMTSGELIAATKLDAAQIYRAVAFLKDRGKIASENSASDGQRRHRPVV